MYLDDQAKSIGWGFIFACHEKRGEVTPEELLDANRDKVEALIEHAKEANKWREDNE